MKIYDENNLVSKKKFVDRSWFDYKIFAECHHLAIIKYVESREEFRLLSVNKSNYSRLIARLTHALYRTESQCLAVCCWSVQRGSDRLKASGWHAFNCTSSGDSVAHRCWLNDVRTNNWTWHRHCQLHATITLYFNCLYARLTETLSTGKHPGNRFACFLLTSKTDCRR